MNKLNIKVCIGAVLGLSLIVWAIVLSLSGIEMRGSIEAIKKLPTVVTVDAFIWFIFTQWAWKLRIFHPWIISDPIIEGTWKGKLLSTWTDPETGARNPFPLWTNLRNENLPIFPLCTKKSTKDDLFDYYYSIPSSTILP